MSHEEQSWPLDTFVKIVRQHLFGSTCFILEADQNLWSYLIREGQDTLQG